jgi:hypothetical protein
MTIYRNLKSHPRSSGVSIERVRAGRIGLDLPTKLIPFACLLLVLSGAAFAADFPLDPTCKTVQNIPYPAADIPTAAEAKTLGTCNSSDLFFGMNGPIDHERGRKCAYLEMEGKVQSTEDVSKDFLRSARLLALIYGNGIGVKQNYPLSEKFACQDEYTFVPVDGYPRQNSDDIAYIKGQVENELKQLEAGRASAAKEPLGLCSSFLQVDRSDLCQPFQIKAERSLAIHRAIDRIAPTDSKRRSALDSLLKAEAAFSKAEEDEIDQDGDSAAVWDFNANRTIDQEFFALLDSLFSNSLANVSESAFASDDQSLNEAYRTLKTEGTTTKKGVEGVERAWIAYRDAWTHFIEVAFPAHPARDVSDFLTRNRTDMLGCLDRGRPYQEFKDGHPECGN